MKIIYGINDFKRLPSPAAICVGVFDGVHIGHQKIIKELVKESAALKVKPVVVTFNPHPLKVLGSNEAVPMLTSLEHRLHLLEELGVSVCLVINFDKSIARQKAKSFIKRVLIDKLNMKMLIAGENFSFGRERIKSPAQLKNIADENNFYFKVVNPKKFHSRVISSSLIRHLIEKGRLNTASKLLGRPVSILGTVVKGRQRGRIIGFKTANIDPHHEAIPPGGVYAVYSNVNGKLYKSVINIGTRPTFNEKEPTIEVHIFGIDRELYGEDIEVYFKKRLRPERRFKNKEHLRAQIMKDAALSRHILKDVL